MIYLNSTHVSENFKIILNSEFDLKNYFKNKKVPFMISLLGVTDECFEIFMESKYFNKELLFEKDLYGHNTLIHILLNGNIEILDIFLELDYFDELLNDLYDIDNEPILSFICTDNDNSIFIDSKYFSEKMFYEMNNLGENIFSILIDSIYNSKCILKLLNSKYFNNKYLLNKNINGNTFLHKCAKYNTNLFKILLTKIDKNILNELLYIKNNLGETIFLLCCKENSESGKHLLKSEYFSKEILVDTDIFGDNCIAISSIKHSDLLKEIINNKYFNKEILFSNRNRLNETAIFLSCKYNGLSTKYILQKETDINNLIQFHTDTSTALLIACKFNLESVEQILNWEYFNDSLLKYNLNNKNILQIICEHKYLAFRYLLQKNCDIEYYIHNYNYNTIGPIDILVERYPDIFKIFMESKYGGYNFYLNMVILDTKIY